MLLLLYFILSEDDFEIKSKIYSLNLRLVLNHILYSEDVLSFRNLFLTLTRPRLCEVAKPYTLT